MAQDYHIYIHSDSAFSPSQATTPFAMRGGETSNGTNGFFSDGESQQQAEETQTKNTGLLKSMSSFGVAALTKVVPWLAIVIAVGKVVQNSVENSVNTYASFTGSYQHSMELNNLKATFNLLSDPVSAVRNIYSSNVDIIKENRAIEARRQLVGNSNLNIYKKGV